MNSGYVCNLIVPGAAKSGTSALHEALNQHPQICMSNIKEPHHFCRLANYSKGSQHHNALFSEIKGKRVFGESSTGYMPWPDAVDKISRDLLSPKIIMVLRDPISRTISHWQWRVKLGLEKRTLSQAIAENGYGYSPENPDRYGYMAYLQFSNYSKYCPLWIERFGSENCLIVSQTNLSENFQDTMTRCFSFLELDDYIFPVVVRSNETSKLGARPKPFMTKLMKPFPEKFKKSTFYNRWRDAVLKLYASPVPDKISEEEYLYLEARLQDDINYFRTVTG